MVKHCRDASASKDVIFWGATGQAKVLKECISYYGLKLVALFDNNKKLQSPFMDIPLYFGEDGLRTWLTSRRYDANIGFLVAIGGDKGRDRIKIHEYLESHGFKPLIVKHPTAYIADDAVIGAGSQILANSSISVGSEIGRSCIINTGAIVDHECHIEDGVHVCPGAHLAGCGYLESFSTIGIGASILPRIKIGRGAIVGAGSVVINNVAAYTVVAGNPAKIIKKLKVVKS